MNSASPNPAVRAIRAYSKAQAMDWSLVLASQDIAAVITHSDEAGWVLEVEPGEYERALQAIRLYRRENRHWGWKQPIPWSHTMFHWGVVSWCALLCGMHWLAAGDPSFRVRGQFASQLAGQGEWWRAFTAVLLHADIAHLLANVTIGFVMLGLAMARYGAGVALLAAYFAGAAGNLAGYLLYSRPYIGVGASGMVMGALALVSVPYTGMWSSHPRAIKHLVQAVFAGIFLFLLVGVDPTSDVVAHAGGYVGGLVFGFCLRSLTPATLEGKRCVSVAWLTLLGTFALTAWRAWGRG